MTSQRPVAAVVWAPEGDRTQQFAERLDAELYCIHYLEFQRPILAPIKYVPQFVKTLTSLYTQHARVVYVTNPPVFAVLSVWFYCLLTGSTYIMDTHSPALYSRRWAWATPLQRALARRARLNIIDQERFRRLFESWGADAIILEKPLKELPRRAPPSRDGPFEITVVNIFAADEPLQPILDAARDLPGVRFYILGDTRRAAASLLAVAPANVTFTGWLHQDAYWQRLQASHAVMALTTYPHSLLAGGHDGMAVERPLLLSDQPALTAYFTGGALFVDNTAAGIAAAVREMQATYPELRQQVIELRHEKQAHWQEEFSVLRAVVDELVGSEE